MEKSNEETRKTINASVNNNLKDFQATVIESVQEMITTQIDKSNKHTMAGVQEIISQKKRGFEQIHDGSNSSSNANINHKSITTNNNICSSST